MKSSEETLKIVFKELIDFFENESSHVIKNILKNKEKVPIKYLTKEEISIITALYFILFLYTKKIKYDDLLDLKFLQTKEEKLDLDYFIKESVRSSLEEHTDEVSSAKETFGSPRELLSNCVAYLVSDYNNLFISSLQDFFKVSETEHLIDKLHLEVDDNTIRDYLISRLDLDLSSVEIWKEEQAINIIWNEEKNNEEKKIVYHMVGNLCAFLEENINKNLKNLIYDEIAEPDLMKKCSAFSFIFPDLLHQYAKRNLKIDENFSLKKKIEQIEIHEPYIYLTEKRYRDHLIHVGRIAVLGDMLLNDGDDKYIDMMPSVKKKILESKKKYQFTDIENEIKRAWFISGLFHDVGYAYPHFKIVFQNLQFFNDSPKIKDINLKIDNLLYEIEKEIGKMGKEFNEKTKRGMNHAIISALYIKYGKGEKKSVKDLAAQTIADHGILDEIDFNDKPLSYLIVLFDEVQEWGRPVSLGKEDVERMRMFFHGEEVFSLENFRQRIEIRRINVKYDSKNEEQSIKYRKLQYEFCYPEEKDLEFLKKHLNFHMLYVLYSKCKKLRRLKDTSKDIGFLNEFVFIYKDSEKDISEIIDFSKQYGYTNLLNWAESLKKNALKDNDRIILRTYIEGDKEYFDYFPYGIELDKELKDKFKKFRKSKRNMEEL